MNKELEKAALSIIPDRSTEGWIDSFGATERIGFIKGATWHAKKHQALLDYVESDLIDRVYEANCPTAIEALKKIKAVVLHPELADKIDAAWVIRQYEINNLNYLDKLGSTYF
jgi:hypothetical protein